MKESLFTLIVVFLTAILSFSHSQDVFAKIDKNRNMQAKDLFHDLNATKDTLILRSPKKIKRLYVISDDRSRELDFYVDAKSYKLPLNKLKKGKHVCVAVQSPLRIVFVVHVLKEMSIARSKIRIEPKSIPTKATEMALRKN